MPNHGRDSKLPFSFKASMRFHTWSRQFWRIVNLNNIVNECSIKLYSALFSLLQTLAGETCCSYLEFHPQIRLHIFGYGAKGNLNFSVKQRAFAHISKYSQQWRQWSYIKSCSVLHSVIEWSTIPSGLSCYSSQNSWKSLQIDLVFHTFVYIKTL